MTEADWLASEDPVAMLRFIELNRGNSSSSQLPLIQVSVSDRKLRLIACACCRDPIIQHSRSAEDIAAVEAAESWADAGEEPDDLPRYHHSGAGWCLWRDAAAAARAWTSGAGGFRAARMADILRDIVGNPSRPVTLPLCRRCGGDYGMRWIDDPDTGRCPWCVRGHECLTPDVVALAHAAYDLRRKYPCRECFKYRGVSSSPGSCPQCRIVRHTEDSTLDPLRLSILADALEQVGCTEDIVAHLRSPGPHVRGCWAVDLIMGRS